MGRGCVELAPEGARFFLGRMERSARMEVKVNQGHERSLPIRRSLTLAYVLSCLVAVLMATASIAGLVDAPSVYPRDELARTFVSNDVANLIIGLPSLLGAMWLARRGKLVGLLCWPGALFYVLYNYCVYVFAMPLNVAFLLHLSLVASSVYAIIAVVASIDGIAVRQRLTGAVPEKVSGAVLAGLGLLFFLQSIGAFCGPLISGTAIGATDRALHATDFLASPAWVIGGVLLWQRKELGYVVGLGLLFQASALFIGLIIFLLLQPLLTSAPFALIDVLVVFLLGLICFIPFVLFVRGVVSKRSLSPAPGA